MAVIPDPNKPGADIGIVVSNADAALAFYRDTLGLEYVASMPMPIGGGGTMHRLACGGTTVKLVCWDTPPAGANPPAASRRPPAFAT